MSNRLYPHETIQQFSLVKSFTNSLPNHKFSAIIFTSLIWRYKYMYHSVLPEDSILPRFHHGQHTSHTVAWKCTESTEWAGSTGESRSLHLRGKRPHWPASQRNGTKEGLIHWRRKRTGDEVTGRTSCRKLSSWNKLYENVTCCSAMLQIQRCQPPSEPRELKHWLQVFDFMAGFRARHWWRGLHLHGRHVKQGIAETCPVISWVHTQDTSGLTWMVKPRVKSLAV